MSLSHRMLGSQPGHHAGIIHNPRTYEMLANLQFLGKRRRIWRQFATASRATLGEKVIDIGCGTGYFAATLAPIVGSGGFVVGIDPSAQLIQYADDHTPVNCGFTVTGAENLPFPDAAFDLAVSSLAFHHIPEELWPQALSEIFRVLRPSGRLFLADYRPPERRWAQKLLKSVGGEQATHDPRPDLKSAILTAAFAISDVGTYPRMHHIVAFKTQTAA
ncbi:class I SAM-dependent methyltransferase [Mycolicibacterium iranicum]|uniref:Methyltransferase domain-containing protein n=3 Tax=Mycobacteriaceae TaxID=1762 RepID=A0ABT4HQA3_MYCIR|nr:methyltransferase domain-containing protein [Mycolicibacterium iranicum]MCZ0731852.1 methyltransferase domain-containing protein [Mycolicibacterium iranicum]SPX90513.1 methyltransferase [Mycolicibacterium chubuense]